MSNSEWTTTTEISKIKSVKRPKVSKRGFAVATAKFACEYFNWDIKRIEKSKISPYINAIGDIHGGSKSPQEEFSGDRYASFAVDVLCGICRSHIKQKKYELLSDSENVLQWIADNLTEINQCKPFLIEVFKILGPTPAHTPTNPANKTLLTAIHAKKGTSTSSTVKESTKKATEIGIDGEKLYQQRARQALPILVKYAKKGKSVTYSELATKLDMPNPRNLNYVLGAIGNALKKLSHKIGIDIPFINTLVINSETGLPGEGLFEFLGMKKDEFSRLSQLQQFDRIEKYHADIFLFNKWNLVLKNLDLKIQDEVLAETLEGIEPDLQQEALLEGGHNTHLIKIAKRNPKARLECLAHYGYDCQICGFNFEDYGEIGKEYIQVHHKEMICDKDEECIIDPINDLIPVCANCHVMLHKKNPPYTIKELKEKLY